MIRGVEERSGGPTRSEKRSPSSLPEKAQKNATNGAAEGHMNPPESKLASDQDTGGSGSAPPLVAIGERLNLDQFEWPKICISLSRKEKEDDFLAMKGTKLPQRPKKRAKNIDKNLQYCFPGMWLSDLTRGRYEVREKKCVRKPKLDLDIRSIMMWVSSILSHHAPAKNRARHFHRHQAHKTVGGCAAELAHVALPSDRRLESAGSSIRAVLADPESPLNSGRNFKAVGPLSTFNVGRTAEGTTTRFRELGHHARRLRPAKPKPQPSREVLPEHFRPTEASEHSPQTTNSRADYKLRPLSHSWTVRRVMGAASLLNLFTLSRLPWGSRDDNDKIEVTRAEVESLRSEIAEAEERETYLKAQLEHLDGILRAAWLCGYLYVRTRWTQLPGEPPIIDDDDIDDWLPRFVVLHGSCIYYYLKSTDSSFLEPLCKITCGIMADNITK
ncbi:PH [Musa troglodytarum]|uniref:PH n=1 Tax=Musa troglodytarum TaxID=320322 RepID=A0A9E7GC43_9LILI|nr:PH [Musa troglodytarum]